MRLRRGFSARANVRYRILITTLTVALIVTFVFSISIGRFSIPADQIIAVLLGQQEGISLNIVSVLVNSRIPRAIAAVFSGMALASAGAAYQGVFQNPLAAPDVLGAASGSACGAALAILAGFTDIGVQMCAFVMGLASVALTYLVSKIVGNKGSMIVYLVLVGMVISAFFDSGISIAKTFADVDDTLPAITFWLMGGLTNVTQKSVAIMAPIIAVGVIALIFIRWKLNLISFDDNEAASMGMNVKAMRLLVVCLATLISSAAVSTCGLVGWVGIIIPHCARLLVGANYLKMLPVTTLLGGIFLLVIDDIARNLLQIEIPLGILTALIGAPLFLWLLFKSRLFAEDR